MECLKLTAARKGKSQLQYRQQQEDNEIFSPQKRRISPNGLTNETPIRLSNVPGRQYGQEPPAHPVISYALVYKIVGLEGYVLRDGGLDRQSDLSFITLEPRAGS